MISVCMIEWNCKSMVHFVAKRYWLTIYLHFTKLYIFWTSGSGGAKSSSTLVFHSAISVFIITFWVKLILSSDLITLKSSEFFEWTLTRCWRIRSRRLVLWSQWLHENGFSWKWIWDICLLSLSLRAKKILHSGHPKGFNLSWTQSTCLFSFSRRLNVFSHCVQTYGLSSKWFSEKCSWYSCSLLKPFEHNGHVLKEMASICGSLFGQIRLAFGCNATKSESILKLKGKTNHVHFFVRHDCMYDFTYSVLHCYW